MVVVVDVVVVCNLCFFKRDLREDWTLILIDSSASEGKNSKQEQTVPNSVPTVLFNYNCPLISLFRAIALSFHSFAPKNGYQLSTDSLTCFPRVGQGVEVGKEHNIGFTRGLMMTDEDLPGDFIELLIK